MPKLEIANKNRYGHRNIEEVPRWDRWDTRMPDVKDQLRAIDLYNKSGAVSKSDFVRARILGEHFKVIMVDKSAVEYNRKLSELTAEIHRIGVNYKSGGQTFALLYGSQKRAGIVEGTYQSYKRGYTPPTAGS